MDVVISILHFISMNFIHKVVNTSPSVRCSSHSQTTSTAGKYNDCIVHCGRKNILFEITDFTT